MKLVLHGLVLHTLYLLTNYQATKKQRSLCSIQVLVRIPGHLPIQVDD